MEDCHPSISADNIRKQLRQIISDILSGLLPSDKLIWRQKTARGSTLGAHHKQEYWKGEGRYFFSEDVTPHLLGSETFANLGRDAIVNQSAYGKFKEIFPEIVAEFDRLVDEM